MVVSGCLQRRKFVADLGHCPVLTGGLESPRASYRNDLCVKEWGQQGQGREILWSSHPAYTIPWGKQRGGGTPFLTALPAGGLPAPLCYLLPRRRGESGPSPARGGVGDASTGGCRERCSETCSSGVGVSAGAVRRALRLCAA